MANDLIEIDGSQGEGGGQVLRTSLSLSCLFQRPFRIFNIRKSRKRPGLMHQHLTCVKAAEQLTNAAVEGARVDSTELIFRPSRIEAGDFDFDIGTAGSISLVMQTVIPCLMNANEKISFTLRGGTHVPSSPSFHYLSEVFCPIITRLGVRVMLSIESYGFYPKGGGSVRTTVTPAEGLKPLRVMQRGDLLSLCGWSGVGNLPLSIAERQREAAVRRLEAAGFHANIGLIEVATSGQGTFLFLEAASVLGLAGFGSLGARGKRAEEVGKAVVREFLSYQKTGAALDPHLADQVVLYLALCPSHSEFTTSAITRHLLTNLKVIGRFLSFRYAVEGNLGQPGTVRIN